MDSETYEQSIITHHLVKTISSFWSNKGYKFKARIVKKEGNIFDIESNIGPSGYPPRI